MEASEPAAEVEGKLLVTSPRGLDRIAPAVRLERHPLRRRRAQRLHTVYLDTPDFALARGGVALRLRRDGTRWEATAKWSGDSRGAVHARPELTVPLAGEPELPFALPEGALRTHLVARVMDRPLHPILITDIYRRRLDVLSTAASRGVLAEIALDEVTLRSPEGHAFASYSEVEIESRGAPPEKIHALTEALRTRFALVPSTHSKAGLGLALLYGDVEVAPAAAEAPAREDSVASAVRKIAALQLARLRDRDPGARTGDDPESLHQMRVATRRLRAALRAFGDAVPPRLGDELRRELQWLGGCLGAVRDLDVHRADVDRHAVALPPAYREALKPFVRYLDEERGRRRAALADALGSERYFQLLAKLDAVSASRPSRERLPPEAQQPITAVGAASAERALRRLVKRGRKIGPAAAPELLHALRIRVKRVRYLYEFFEDLCGKSGRRVVKRLTRIQDLLGSFQDAVVIAEMVCRYLDLPEAAAAPSTVLALQEFAQARLRDTAALRAEFDREWRKLAAKRMRRTAKAAVEKLRGSRAAADTE